MRQAYLGNLVGSHSFSRQVLITFTTQIAGLLISIATTAIIARSLGPSGKGALTLVLLVPAMLGLFLSGGIGIANVYFAGSHRLGVPTLAANSVAFAALAALGGLGLVGGLWTVGWFEALVPGVPVSIVMLALLAFPVGLLNGYFSAILQGLQYITALSLVTLVQGVLALGLTLLLVAGFQLRLIGAVLASLAAGVVSLGLIMILLRREGSTFRPRWDLAVMRSTLAFGLRGYIGNVLQFFNYRLDTFIVNYFLGLAGVGIYSVAVGLAELLWHLPNAVGFVIFPRAAANRPQDMNTFTPRIFRVTLGVTALGACGLALLGWPLIRLIYSPAFAGAYIPLLILLPGVVLLGGGKVLTSEIAGRGYPHYNSFNAALALVLTVVLDVLLIPRYGVTGAAIASSVAYTSNFLTAIGFYRAVSRHSSAGAISPGPGNAR